MPAVGRILDTGISLALGEMRDATGREFFIVFDAKTGEKINGIQSIVIEDKCDGAMFATIKFAVCAKER